jgi:hypothetical protein
VTEKRRNSLSSEDLAAARQRALSAGPLPDSVRRELVNIWNRQTQLPKEQRALLSWQFYPSGWVITHLVPLLCNLLSRALREKDGEASLQVAEVLGEVAERVQFDIQEAVQILVQLRPEGKGSRFAGQCQVNVLRVLDLGIVGLPFMAAVYASTLGLIDISCSIVCEGNFTVSESVEEARRLGSKIEGELTEGDWSWSNFLWIPSDFLPPDDFNPVPIESIPTW